MSDRTKAYPRAARERIWGSRALSRLIAHANGEEELTATEVRTCEFLVNKVLPNPPTSTVELDADQAEAWQLKL